MFAVTITDSDRTSARVFFDSISEARAYCASERQEGNSARVSVL